MPLAIFFLLEHFNAVIGHVDQVRIGKKLTGQHSHVFANLHTRHTEIVALSEQFAVDGLQELGDSFVVVNPLVRHTVEISEAVFGP